MEQKKAIRAFAEKWLDRLSRGEGKTLTGQELGQDCRRLGFSMDCGRSFEAVYGVAVYDGEALEKVVSRIRDPMLLGSAIYSRWRYWSYWAYMPEDILSQEKWFRLALGRLGELGED